MSHHAGMQVGYNAVPLVPCSVFWDVKSDLPLHEVEVKGRGPELPSKHTQEIIPQGLTM